ncbi:odorant receptor coreceptor-like isoform X1 [Anabrus simplex]|uniref:odorant receptor coreceptor-like isoform X1 n=1 Tax=Anabrus simplex TaxID=316456 RepID=UPI0035A2767C
MNKLMLSQFFTSIIVFCTVTFQVIMFPADRMKLIGMSGFLTGEAVQLFMYCYFADKIREETDLIATSAYFSRWPDMSKSMKNLLMIIMARSQKATKFTVGKFTELSLDTFANILKASYTYLMMLIEMDER